MSSTFTGLAKSVRAGPHSALCEAQHHRRRTKRRDRAESVEQTSQPLIEVKGVLELHPKGYGFLRDVNRDLQAAPGDVFVPSNLIQRLGLRAGAIVEGAAVKLRSAEGPSYSRSD